MSFTNNANSRGDKFSHCLTPLLVIKKTLIFDYLVKHNISLENT